MMRRRRYSNHTIERKRKGDTSGEEKEIESEIEKRRTWGDTASNRSDAKVFCRLVKEKQEKRETRQTVRLQGT